MSLKPGREEGLYCAYAVFNPYGVYVVQMKRPVGISKSTTNFTCEPSQIYTELSELNAE
jgi:hypothetical protein